MTTAYSNWSDGWKPSGSSTTKHYRAVLIYSVSNGDTKTTVNSYVQVNVDSAVNASYSGKMWASNGSTFTGTAKTSYDNNIKTATIVSQHSYSWNRSTTNQTKYVYGSVKSSNGTWDGNWMQATASITVPALTSYTISYDKNGGNSGTVNNQTKYYSVPLTLTQDQFRWLDSQGEDAFAFLNWNTASDGSGTSYLSGGSYTNNSGATLYAQWQALNPPTCEYTPLEDFNGYSRYVKGFSDIGATVSNIQIKDDTRLPIDVTLYVGGESTTHTLNSLSSDIIWVTPTTSGTKSVMLEITDSASAKAQYDLGEITVADPLWTIDATFSTALPDINAFGNAIITVYAGVYSSGTFTNTYDEISGDYKVVDNGDNTWSLAVQIGETYVKNPASTTPEAKIKVEYNHTEVEEKAYRQAFYATTRNANYSTGIANTMFISGCEHTNYTSRVWWSEVNNPLYFPDTNYVEVGSNDTSVMGLTKVGDYLGAVKQSKTTDTAIFLIYPTSFEDNTTYAVKQLSSGVGAYGRYCFNVLGDETLFLSPNGVMAIVPSQDEQHNVQNRSYFIDGKLLKEDGLADAYSFVFDGKYYLAINDCVYVLDGNQRNSWGNDKTNLVYECYFLENVPANCFVKYNETLMFSNDYGLCRFKNKDDDDAYIDGYNTDGGQENVTVKARWSTVLDDDGALNYYKTMQKKGNVVSVLPNTPFRYEEVTITEGEFNADKKSYFTLHEGDYIRCTSESVYDPDMQYYIREKTGTKVFVRKDNNEPVEIERHFNESTEIPSELFINKKFKKYKRLQFILENNENEPFGVDSIVKQYTVGNYAKR